MQGAATAKISSYKVWYFVKSLTQSELHWHELRLPLSLGSLRNSTLLLLACAWWKPEQDTMLSVPRVPPHTQLSSQKSRWVKSLWASKIKQQWRRVGAVAGVWKLYPLLDKTPLSCIRSSNPLLALAASDWEHRFTTSVWKELWRKSWACAKRNF